MKKIQTGHVMQSASLNPFFTKHVYFQSNTSPLLMFFFFSFSKWSKQSVLTNLRFLKLVYRNFWTISRDFFPQLLTLRLKQRMWLIYGFFSIWGASHPRLFLASFQLASKRVAAIWTSLCSVLFISKVSQEFVSIFKHSVKWSIHNNF